MPALHPPFGWALPDARFHSVVLSSKAVHFVAEAPLAPGQSPARATAAPHLLVPPTARTQPEHCVGSTPSLDSRELDQIGPDLLGSVNRWRFVATSNCRRREPARRTIAESAQLATLPADANQREALGQGQVNSDDRIANSLFAPVLRQSSASNCRDKHEPNPPEAWDARWDLFEMAAAQRGDWTRQCPCPVYVDNPAGVPR